MKYPGKKSKDVMNWEDLRSYGIKWYKDRGVDFSGMDAKLKKAFK